MVIVLWIISIFVMIAGILEFVRLIVVKKRGPVAGKILDIIIERKRDKNGVSRGHFLSFNVEFINKEGCIEVQTLHEYLSLNSLKYTVCDSAGKKIAMPRNRIKNVYHIGQNHGSAIAVSGDEFEETYSIGRIMDIFINNKGQIRPFKDACKSLRATLFTILGVIFTLMTSIFLMFQYQPELSQNICNKLLSENIFIAGVLSVFVLTFGGFGLLSLINTFKDIFMFSSENAVEVEAKIVDVYEHVVRSRDSKTVQFVPVYEFEYNGETKQIVSDFKHYIPWHCKIGTVKTLKYNPEKDKLKSGGYISSIFSGIICLVVTIFILNIMFAL